MSRWREVGLFGRYVGPHRGQLALLALLLLSSIGLQLVNPQLLRYFIDAALAGAPVTALALAAVAFIAIALLTQTFTALAQYVGVSLGWRATNALRADLMRHCLTLDLGFHKEHRPGELVERIDGDVTALAGFFSRFVVNVLGNIVLLLGVLAMVWREDWRAGVALGVFAVVALLVLVRLRTVAVGRWRAVREAWAQLLGFLAERLGGTEDIRASGAVAYVMHELGEQHRAWLRARRRASAGTSVIWAATILTFAVGAALAFAVGGTLFLAGSITVGTVYLLLYYTDLLRRPIEQLRRELEDLQQAVASIARVQELLATSSPLVDGHASPPAGQLSVEFDRVTFAYAAEPVLRELSLRIDPGRVLGVLGRTGSGKTTLARLLLRFYDPTAGTIRLGDADLRGLRLRELRGSVTLVTQDVQLFHATVRDNVTFFDPSIRDADAQAVLERLGLGAWLRRAGGLDGVMTAAGLSAGEAQLLAFARVFLRQPGVVILDEASSRLDPLTERLIERATDALLAGRTAVVIAHRLETVARCDEIVILEDGRVVESGARAALAADPGSRFAGLLRTGAAEILV